MNWLLKLATGNPVTLLWIAGAIAVSAGAAGATAGWQLNGWRLGAEVAEAEVKLANAQARVAVLEPANDKCAADVEDVRQAFVDLKAAEAARTARAAAAIATAEPAAKGHENAANGIMLKPRPKPGEECPTIIQEERDYVTVRQIR